MVLLHTDHIPGLRADLHLKTSALFARQGRFPAIDVFGAYGLDSSVFDGPHLPRLIRGYIGPIRRAVMWGSHREKALSVELVEWEQSEWEQWEWEQLCLWSLQAMRALLEQPPDQFVSRAEQIALVRGWSLIRYALPPSRIPAWQALLLSRIDSSIPIDTGYGRVQRTLPEALVTILEEAAATALREAGITQTD